MQLRRTLLRLLGIAMTTQPVRVNGRNLKPHKSTVAPELGTRTVLTNSPWDFVALWLRRSGKPDALFFWNQSRMFANAAQGMPFQSAPLLHYYSFMNATKALLASKGITPAPLHGVGQHNMRGISTTIDLSNEGVKIQARGVLPALSIYLGELESSTIHSMEELLFNIPCIHRTFCLTYSGQDDLFIPLTDCEFVFDPSTSRAHFVANLSQDFDDPVFVARLPPSLVPDSSRRGTRHIRSRASVGLSGATLTTPTDIQALASLQRQLRPDLQYLNGAQTLWYAKAFVPGPARLQRSPLTLTLAAMHRMSELCRYRPMELTAFFDGPKNWLLSEFIQMAPSQFLDEISAEITGHQFMTPNVRPAT